MSSDIAHGDNGSDYHQLAELFERVQSRIIQLDDSPEGLHVDGELSLAKLKVWVQLVDTARKTIEGLNKMRNSDRMTLHILSQHTQKLSVRAIRGIATEIVSIADVLDEMNDPKLAAIVQRLRNFAFDGAADLIAQNAEDSLHESRDQYKLLQ